MADDSDDVIYIDVVPKVDEAAADEAESRLRDKFKDVAKDVGSEFWDAFSSDEVLGQLGGPLHDLTDSLSKSLDVSFDDAIEKLIHKDFGGAFEDVVGNLGEKFIEKPLNDLAEKVGIDLPGVMEKALNKDFEGALTDALGGLGDKFIAEPLNDLASKFGVNLNDAMEKVLNKDFSGALEGVASDLTGINVHGVTGTIKALRSGDLGGALGGINDLTGGGLQPLADTHEQIKQTVSDTKELAEGFLAGSARSAAIGPAVEALGPVAASLATTGIAEDALKDLSGIGPTAKDLLPDGSLSNRLAAPFRMIGGDIMHPSRLWNNTRQYDHNGNFIGDGPAEPNHTDLLYQGVFGGAGSGGGGGKTTANEVEVQANDAVISAGSVTLGGSINLPSISIPTSSGGGRSASSSSIGTAGSSAGGGGSGSGLGGAGSFSGLGFDEGGVLPGDSPGHDNIFGTSGGHPIGLEGGEFVVNPKATRDNMDLLQAINSGSHFDEGGLPPFDPQNPSQPMPPTQGNQPQGPIQQKSIGTGQGAGVSGGGIIGAAEQAGVMAAAAGGFGAGGIAAQMAEQEMNLAVQKGSQMAWAAASAPLETLWLGGGQMGAPQLQSPLFGWPGKVLGSLIGQQTNLPNMAHATQPPKQPDQKDEKDQHGQDVAKGGPVGSKDDPMHVNVTNQPQPGPGAMNSAANFSALTAVTSL